MCRTLYTTSRLGHFLDVRQAVLYTSALRLAEKCTFHPQTSRSQDLENPFSSHRPRVMHPQRARLIPPPGTVVEVDPTRARLVPQNSKPQTVNTTEETRPYSPGMAV